MLTVRNFVFHNSLLIKIEADKWAIKSYPDSGHTASTIKIIKKVNEGNQVLCFKISENKQQLKCELCPHLSTSVNDPVVEKEVQRLVQRSNNDCLDWEDVIAMFDIVMDHLDN